MRYVRYSWSVLLLVAAILAPDGLVTVTLLVAGSINLLLAASREQRLQRIMHDLADTLPFVFTPTQTSKQSSTALERSLQSLQKQLLLLAGLAELVIFTLLLLGALDLTVARNYALLVLVALAPLGLEAELAVLLRTAHKRTSETVRTAVGYAAEDARTLLAILGLSLVGTLWLQIPPALSVLQILIITCVARPLLSGRALQATPHKVDQRWRVLFSSLIVYGSFVFFFIRHYLDPRFADATNPVTWQATTVALLTFVACQAALLVLNPQAPKSAFYRAGLLLSILLVVAYLRFTQTYFMTTGPDPSDWLWITVAGLLYTALCLLQRYSRIHSRQEVLALHRQIGRR